MRVEGLDTRESDVGVLAQKVGYVYQDFENQIVRPTVLDDASYSCLNYGLPRLPGAGQGRVEAVRPGGPGGRVRLAALRRPDPPAGPGRGGVSSAGHPDSGRAHRPVGPYARRRIYAVLRDLNENHGKTIVVIEHHTEYIADFCKHVMLMRDGQVRWMLPTGEALQRWRSWRNAIFFRPGDPDGPPLRKAGRLPADIPLPTTVEEERPPSPSCGMCRARPGRRRRPPEMRRFPFRMCPSPTAR